jgi:hypothetical protein
MDHLMTYLDRARAIPDYTGSERANGQKPTASGDRQFSGASEESCIRKAVSERGFNSSLVGLADAKAEDEAASRWADCAVAYGV